MRALLLLALVVFPYPTPSAPSSPGGFKLHPAVCETPNSVVNPSNFADFSWRSGYYAATAVPNSPLCPRIPGTSTRMTWLPHDLNGIYDNVASAPGGAQSAWMAIPTGGAACTMRLGDWAGSSDGTQSLTATPTKFTHVGGGNGVWIRPGSCGAGQGWCMWCARVYAP